MWEFALKIIQRILDMVRIVVLARLLSPGDFGIFDIAILTAITLETFTVYWFWNRPQFKRKAISNHILILSGP